MPAPFYDISTKARTLWLGDSITHGYNDSVADSPVDEIVPLLTATVINAGRNGETSTQVAARAASNYTGNGAAGVAICLIGVNDINGGASAATIEANLSSIAAACPSGCRFVCILPFGGYSGWTSGKETVRAAVNTWIKANTTNYTDVDSILGDGVRPSLQAGYTVAGAAAGLHVNATGAGLLAAAVFAQSFNSTPISG